MSKEFDKDRGSGVLGVLLILSLGIFMASLVVFATGST